jgi:hypothetical protein
MRNETLVKICENIAKQANEYAKKRDFLRAKVYSGIALDFLKLANATPSDFKRISNLLPDLEEETSASKLSVGAYREGRWEVW